MTGYEIVAESHSPPFLRTNSLCAIDKYNNVDAVSTHTTLMSQSGHYVTSGVLQALHAHEHVPNWVLFSFTYTRCMVAIGNIHQSQAQCLHEVAMRDFSNRNLLRVVFLVCAFGCGLVDDMAFD